MKCRCKNMRREDKPTGSSVQLVTMAALCALLLVAGVGCRSGQTDSRSMEKIYAEEGVPVKVQVMTPQSFANEAEYTAALTGREESSAYAMVTDRIESINATVGDWVAKDSVIVTFPTDNPSAQYYQAKVQYENAESTFDRMRQYFESGGLSRQDFENAQASFEVARANWDAVRKSVHVLAPISGVITRLNVRESDNVESDDELFTISNTQRLKATVWVPDKDIRKVSVGQSATATWNGVTLQGSVVQVDHSVNQQHQAFGVVLEFDNPRTLVPSGVTAAVSVAIYENASCMVTARKNVLKDEQGSYVYLADSDRAEKRYVALGQAHQLDVEIKQGLEPGDRLIVEGQLHLRDGSLLKLMNGESTPTDDSNDEV